MNLIKQLEKEQFDKLSAGREIPEFAPGDTVKFVDLRPPRILITGRTAYNLSAFGEHLIAEEIEKRTGFESRVTILGHIQRGGTPTAFDRVLATRFGLGAIDAVQDGAYGQMVALRGTDIVRVPLAEATAELKTVPIERYAEAEVFFG